MLDALGFVVRLCSLAQAAHRVPGELQVAACRAHPVAGLARLATSDGSSLGMRVCGLPSLAQAAHHVARELHVSASWAYPVASLHAAQRLPDGNGRLRAFEGLRGLALPANLVALELYITATRTYPITGFP